MSARGKEREAKVDCAAPVTSNRKRMHHQIPGSERRKETRERKKERET